MRKKVGGTENKADKGKREGHRSRLGLDCVAKWQPAFSEKAS